MEERKLSQKSIKEVIKKWKYVDWTIMKIGKVKCVIQERIAWQKFIDSRHIIERKKAGSQLFKFHY